MGVETGFREATKHVMLKTLRDNNPLGVSRDYLDGIDKWDDPGKHFHTGPVVFANDKDKLKEEEEMKELANPVERKLYILGRELKPMSDIELINLIGTIDDKITLREKLAEQSTRIAKYVQDLREGRKLVMKELDSREDAA